MMNTLPDRPIKVGFVLQEHFSMMSFTAALDAIVTANLTQSKPLFEFVTLGVNSRKVTSDLGFDIATDDSIQSLTIERRDNLEILVICGGFRTPLKQDLHLTTYLKAADKLGIKLCGLWNGAIPMLHAGLLDQQRFAIHPDNHAYISETFPDAPLSSEVLEFNQKRATCSGPNSALDMMLTVINDRYGREITRAVREILSCDSSAENRSSGALIGTNIKDFPQSLSDIIELMQNNIEEPLTLSELSECSNISRRQMERQFQIHLDKPPSRFYLELRLNHARRLLQQTTANITNIAIASGFVSSSHFSNCYKDYFGISPRAARQSKHNA